MQISLSFFPTLTCVARLSVNSLGNEKKFNTLLLLLAQLFEKSVHYYVSKDFERALKMSQLVVFNL